MGLKKRNKKYNYFIAYTGTKHDTHEEVWGQCCIRLPYKLDTYENIGKLAKTLHKDMGLKSACMVNFIRIK